MNQAASEVAAGDRRRAARPGRRRAARRPRGVPPGDAPCRADRDEAGALGVRVPCAGRLGGSEMGRTRVVPRGPRAAAHAARRRSTTAPPRPRPRRAHRREGLGLQGRQGPAPRAGDRARARSRARQRPAGRHGEPAAVGRPPSPRPCAEAAVAASTVVPGDRGVRAERPRPPRRSRSDEASTRPRRPRPSRATRRAVRR